MKPQNKNPYAHSALFIAILLTFLLISMIFTIPFSDADEGIIITSIAGSALLSLGVFMFILKNKMPKFLDWIKVSMIDDYAYNIPDTTIDFEKEGLLKPSTVRKNIIVGLLFFIPGLLLWVLVIWVIFFK